MKTLAVCLVAALALHAQPREAAPDAKPSLSMRASPMMGFSPTRVFLVAEIKGGPNDYEDFYCASIEWDWGDSTKSQATYDCVPYEAGKSEIKRRYAVEHVFQRSGRYQVQFKLKRKDKVLAAVRTTIQIRPGVREID